MTSVMRRPQSTQPGDLGRGELTHTPGRTVGTDAPQHVSNGHAVNGNGSAFSMPSPSALELPASLLDQAPEYEYSVHTQSNVFDAVHDYTGAGEEEAARVFGLDRYDPSVHHDASRQSISGEGGNDDWSHAAYSIKHDDLSSSQGHSDAQQSIRIPAMAHYTNTSLGSGDGMASFQEAGSMVSSSEYPMAASTAPTSRASEWKLESSNASIGSDANIHDASFPSYKHRRDSYEDSIREGSASATATSNSPTTLFSYQQATPQHGRDDDGHRGRNLHQGPLVPSQGSGSGGMHARSRIASWGGENVHYNDDWSSMSSGSLNMPAPSSGVLRSGYTAIQGGPVRQGHYGMERSGQSRPDMMSALGSAMDATMETDGIAKCPYPNCTKTFAKNRSYNLKAHLRSHSQLKPYQCTHCPRAFSRKHDLERHSRVHSGDKPYLCEACGKGFPRSDALRRHWRVEKECGDKAVEIEAKQPLPSLPPGVNVPSAHAHGPMPGVLHVGPAVTTPMSGSGMPTSMSLGSGLHAYGQLQHQQVQLQHQYHHQQPSYNQQPHHQASVSHMGHPYQQGGMGMGGNGAISAYPYQSQQHDSRSDRSER